MRVPVNDVFMYLLDYLLSWQVLLHVCFAPGGLSVFSVNRYYKIVPPVLRPNPNS